MGKRTQILRQLCKNRIPDTEPREERPNFPGDVQSRRDVVSRGGQPRPPRSTAAEVSTSPRPLKSPGCAWKENSERAGRLQRKKSVAPSDKHGWIDPIDMVEAGDS